MMDVENVETTYFDNSFCAFFAALSSFLLQFCLINISLASLEFCANCVFIVLSRWRYIRLNISTTSAARLSFVL